ncbi:O-antigen ligase family protein, partial [Candidatus Saccharibacteria bacterium]|nr:O-antigen ligase family protein [Candidatus Saccharibacteria bacterium]
KPSINNSINGLLLALYLGWLAIFRYFTNMLSTDSILLTMLPVAVVLAVSLIVNRRSTVISKSTLTVGLITVVILALSAAFLYNPVVLSYGYNFLVYGLIPLYLIGRLNDISSFFKYFAYVSMFTVLILGLDPLDGYAITGDYMVYGYYVMLPAFVALYISRKYYGIKWLLLFEILTLFLIIVFANRDAALAAIALVIMSNLLVDTVTRRRLLLIGLSSVIILIGLLNIEIILEWGINIAQDSGGSSYALETIHRSLSGETDGLSGRDALWSNVPAMFNESPIIGHGIAAFEHTHAIYTHNIILEVLVSFGIVGVVTMLVYGLYYIYRMIKSDRVDRLPYVIGISIGVIPLMFSMQPFIWYFFWLFSVNPSQKIDLSMADNLKKPRRQ